MGLMSLFRRKPMETRATGSGYTALVMASRASFIAGTAGMGELTATVQTAVSLWEAGLSLADVTGTDMLDRQTMALCARSLALRGEALFLIRDRLVPAIDWDLSTRDGQPRAYRCQIPEVGGGRGETVLAPEVLHFRIGCDPVTPWAGSAPLKRAQLSAELLGELETALRDVFRDAPLGSQIVPVPEGSADDMEALRQGFRGRRGAALVIEGVAQATAAGMNPNLGQKPDQLSPDLARTLADKMLTEAKGAILGAYGVLPGPHERGDHGADGSRGAAASGATGAPADCRPDGRGSDPQARGRGGYRRCAADAGLRPRRQGSSPGDHGSSHGAGERGRDRRRGHEGCPAIHRLERLTC